MGIWELGGQRTLYVGGYQFAPWAHKDQYSDNQAATRDGERIVHTKVGVLCMCCQLYSTLRIIHRRWINIVIPQTFKSIAGWPQALQVISFAAAQEGIGLVLAQDANTILMRPSDLDKRRRWPLTTSSDDLMCILLCPQPLLKKGNYWPMRATDEVQNFNDDGCLLISHKHTPIVFG